LLDQFERPKADKGLIFPGLGGKPLSDMSLNKVLRAVKLPYHAHGFSIVVPGVGR
jgi:hypothetical protein